MLLLLGSVILIAFGVLFLAIVTYTQVTVMRSRVDAVKQLAETISVESFPKETLHQRLETIRATPLLDQAAFYSLKGKQLAATASGSARTLPQDVPDLDSTRQNVWSEHRTSLEIYGPVKSNGGSTLGHIGLLVAESTPQTKALNPLLALYMGLVAVLLLTGAYFTVTHWIIQPVSELSLNASRVTISDGSLQLDRPRSRELALLSERLTQMHEKLQRDEAALRKKVVEVETATKQLATAQRQLVRSERLASVGQLAAGLAHEIGNPIAAMQGLQELILHGDLEREQELDFMQRLHKETERISRILRDLLQFARVERPKHSDEEDASSPGNLALAVEEILALIAPQPLFRKMMVRVEIPPGLPDVAMSHEHLVQVLLNLVLNAGQACSGDGALALVGKRRDDAVTLRVQDNGPGIPPALGESVFEPFISSKDVGQGSGLGLSVCRGLVEAAGGSIEIDSTYRLGAQLLLTLPTVTS